MRNMYFAVFQPGVIGHPRGYQYDYAYGAEGKKRTECGSAAGGHSAGYHQYVVGRR